MDPGSNVVAAVNERTLVKIFPPFHLYQRQSERRAEPLLSGRRVLQQIRAAMASAHAVRVASSRRSIRNGTPSFASNARVARHGTHCTACPRDS
jgi:hypothetical protein